MKPGGSSYGKKMGFGRLPLLGVTRIGSFTYADRPITDQHEYSQAATRLLQARGGQPVGTSKFVCEDVTRTIGYATAAGIRNRTQCKFRLLIRDGNLRFEDLCCWKMSY
jgi:hypothetical protein